MFLDKYIKKLVKETMYEEIRKNNIRYDLYKWMNTLYEDKNYIEENLHSYKNLTEKKINDEFYPKYGVQIELVLLNTPGLFFGENCKAFKFKIKDTDSSDFVDFDTWYKGD